MAKYVLGVQRFHSRAKNVLLPPCDVCQLVPKPTEGVDFVFRYNDPQGRSKSFVMLHSKCAKKVGIKFPYRTLAQRVRQAWLAFTDPPEVPQNPVTIVETQFD